MIDWRLSSYWKSLISATRRFVLPSFLVFAVVLLWKVLDPFGYDSALTGTAQLAVARAYGAWYPRGFCLWNCNRLQDGSRLVTVVLLDDEYKTGLGYWPPSYSDYANMIRVLAEHGATAVFVDLVIQDRPGDLQGLLDEVRADRAKGLKLILAQLPMLNEHEYHCPNGPARMGGAMSKDLACAADWIVPISWLTAIPALDYPLVVARESDGGKNVSPGFALAAALNAHPEEWIESFKGRQNDDLFLAWGVGAENPGICSGESDPEVGRGVAEHAAMAVRAAFFDHFDDREGGRCTFLPSIQANDFLATRETSGPFDWLTVDHLVRGHAVLLGAAVSGLKDFVDPPIGPRLPGVFAHATAAENLLSLGPNEFAAYQNPEPFEADNETLLRAFPWMRGVGAEREVVLAATAVGLNGFFKAVAFPLAAFLKHALGRPTGHSPVARRSQPERGRVWLFCIRCLRAAVAVVLRATMVIVICSALIAPWLGLGASTLISTLFLVFCVESAAKVVEEIADEIMHLEGTHHGEVH